MLNLDTYNVQPMFNVDDGGNLGGGETPTTPNESATSVSTPAPETKTGVLNIEGFGEVTADQLKEWKSGYMRQSDYTKKTQEIARMRKENDNALKIYQYLQSNPSIAEAISQGDYSKINNTPIANMTNPLTSQLDELNLKIASIELDKTIELLKAKYDDFNEVEVLTEADKLGLSDLEFVYKALSADKMKEKMMNLKNEIRKELTDEIIKNGLSTQTIINSNDSQAENDIGLSDAQIIMASKMGMSPEQYKNGLKRLNR